MSRLLANDFYGPADKKPPENWPTQGALRFEHMFLRYKETDQPVLNNVTCVIQAKEKVLLIDCLV